MSRQPRLVEEVLLSQRPVCAVIDPTLHNDFRSCVLDARRGQTGRGKRITLDATRLGALDTALRAADAFADAPPPAAAGAAGGATDDAAGPSPAAAGAAWRTAERSAGSTVVTSLDHLGALAVEFRQAELKRESDGAMVGAYYDGRAEAYNTHNLTSQHRLTKRTFDFAGLLRPGTLPRKPVVLDLGSGTGLSSASINVLLSEAGSSGGGAGGQEGGAGRAGGGGGAQSGPQKMGEGGEGVSTSAATGSAATVHGGQGGQQGAQGAGKDAGKGKNKGKGPGKKGKGKGKGKGANRPSPTPQGEACVLGCDVSIGMLRERCPRADVGAVGLDLGSGGGMPFRSGTWGFAWHHLCGGEAVMVQSSGV